MSHPFPDDLEGTVDIVVGGLRARAGYVVLSHGNLPVKIYITPEQETLIIQINFAVGNISAVQTIVSDDRLSLTFNIPEKIDEFTIGSSEPLRIGVAIGKGLFVAIRCVRLSEEMKAIYFSLYTEI